MPYKSQAHLDSLDIRQYAKVLGTHIPLGTHPETMDRFLIPTIDCYAGTYITGLPGMGKSGLLENMIAHDIFIGHSVIVIDPHGDLIQHCIAQMSEEALERTYLLDMEDESYPFGLNVFNGLEQEGAVAQAQAIDRVMHVFDVLWGDILLQAYLPRFLRAACIVLFANLGSTLVDMHRLLVDSAFRAKLLQAVKDPTVTQFWGSFDALSATQQRQQVEPLIGRLESIFMGRSLVRNILGQRETSIDFRKASENKEIIFIRVPLKTLAQDSRLIGTLLIAQIHAAIFSFSDIPEDRRPGFSLYVDEFQHFATPDFSEMFTEGRKFGVRVTVAHQYRGQLPTYLRESTMTARTKGCLQTTPDDAREMAHLFLNGESTVQPEDVEPHPIEHLLKYGSVYKVVQTFTDAYLRPLQSQKHGGYIEIRNPGFRAGSVPYWMLSVKPPEEKPKVADPTPYLNHLLYEVMKTGNDKVSVPPQIVYGFSNIGRGFYSTFLYALNKRNLLTDNVRYPSPMIVEGADGLYCARPPDSSKEQMYHFLFHLHATMAYLAANPIGKKSTVSASDVAHMLTQLPKRAAFVRSGTDVGVIYTDDSLTPVDAGELRKRLYLIRGQTRQKYCKPIDEFDRNTDVPTNPTDEPPMSRWEEVQ